MRNVNIYINGYYRSLNVLIIDNCNNLILNTKTCKNKINVCLKESCSYKIVINYSNNILISTFIVNNKNNNFHFYLPNNLITLNLKDYYYNLPIEKGEITLWQKQ